MAFWREFWTRATAPSEEIHDSYLREQARLLSGISLVTLLAGLFTIIFWVATDTDFTLAWLVGAAFLFILSSLYLVSRTKHFRIGALAFILLYISLLGLAALLSPGPPGETSRRLVMLIFLTVPVWMASVFFNFVVTLAISFLSIGFIAIFALVPAFDFNIVFVYIVFIMQMSLLLLVTNVMQRSFVRRLQESERRYRALFDQANSGVCLMDLQGHIRELNDHALAVLGYSREELLGMQINDLVAPAELVDSAEMRQRMFAGERLPIYERTFLRKDGRPVIVEVNVEIVHDRAGRPLHIQSVLHDITERNAAERALSASEARFRQLTEQSPDTIYIFDCLENKMKFINRREFLGYSVTELQRDGSILHRVHVSDRKRVAEFWQQLITTNEHEVLSLDYQVQHKEGHWEWVFARGTVLSCAEEGKPAELLVTLTPITEQKRLQAVLQEREEQFQTLVETVRAIPWVFDMETKRFTYVGPQVEEMLGYPIQEWFTEKFWPRHVHAEDWAHVFEISTRGVAECENYSMEYRMVAADGHDVWLHEVVTVEMDEAGRKTLRGIMIDVTDRKETEEKLAQQEEQLRILLEQAPIGIVTVDNAGIVSAANPRSLEILGSPGLEQTIGLNVLTLPPLIEAGASAAFAQALETGEMVQTETPYTSLWGKQTFVMTRAVPHFDNNGQQIGLIILLEDLTERRQAEEALRQAQKMESLGVLAGGIAHDFNNLLVAMLGQISLARRQVAASHPAQAAIGKAETAAQKAANLTQQMLAYSGRGHFQIAPLNLNDLLRDNLHLFTTMIPKRITLRTELDTDLPLIEADVAQIQQLVMNLLINAVEAIGEEAGEVLLRTAVTKINPENQHTWQYTALPLQLGCYVQLSITDTGRGMSAETLARIFDPFFSTKEKGHGLGLAAVLGIVKGHQGGLVVRSVLDEGTTFDFVFPISTSAVKLPEPSPEPSGQEETVRKVLVIDDEALVREAVTDILAAVEIEVLPADCGQAGLALYQRHFADIGLVLLDLSMPGWDGVRTMQELRRFDPDVRILLSSGYSQAEVLSRFSAEASPAGFLKKPYSVSELLAVVQAQLSGNEG